MEVDALVLNFESLSNQFMISAAAVAKQMGALRALLRTSTLDSRLTCYEKRDLSYEGLLQLDPEVAQKTLKTLERHVSAFMTQAVAKLAARLQQMADSLENRIPKYSAYVVEEFNVDMVRKEIVNNNLQLEGLAKDWAKFARLFGGVKSVCNEYTGGSFEIAHTSVAKVCDRSLSETKNFIPIASTAKLILEDLPQAAKSERAGMIETQLAKIKNSGAELPRNLIKYLDAELAKLRKPSKPK